MHEVAIGPIPGVGDRIDLGEARDLDIHRSVFSGI
jgi:hypothetical protein